MGAPEDVILAQRGDEADHGGLLAHSRVDRSSQTSAPIHVVESGLQRPTQDHELVEFEKTLVGQVLRRGLSADTSGGLVLVFSRGVAGSRCLHRCFLWTFQPLGIG